MVKTISLEWMKRIKDWLPQVDGLMIFQNLNLVNCFSQNYFAWNSNVEFYR